MTTISKIDWMNRIRAVQHEEGQRENLELNSHAQKQFAAWNLSQWLPSLPHMSDEAFQLTQLVIGLLKRFHLHVHTSSQQETDEERRERESRRAVSTGAAVLIGATSYIAYQWENHNHGSQVLKKAQQYLQEARQLPNSPMKPYIQELFIHKLRIEELTVNKNQNYFYSGVGFFVSGAALVTGGLRTDRSIMKWGALGCIISVVAVVANFFYHKRDPEKISHLRDIILGEPSLPFQKKGYADFILEQLAYLYNDRMEPSFAISPAPQATDSSVPCSDKMQPTPTAISPQPGIPSSALVSQHLYPQTAGLQDALFPSRYQSDWIQPPPPPTFTLDNPSAKID